MARASAARAERELRSSDGLDEIRDLIAEERARTTSAPGHETAEQRRRRETRGSPRGAGPPPTQPTG